MIIQIWKIVKNEPLLRKIIFKTDVKSIKINKIK